jgi:hypothetical protein
MNFFREKSIGDEIAIYWDLTAYVTDDTRAASMRTHLAEAGKAIASQDSELARDFLNQARREYVLARREKKVFFWRSWQGMFIALALLIIFSATAASGLVFQTEVEAQKYILLFAGLGGGIGGCAAVLIRVIDVDPHSEVVSKLPWYVIKPCLGAVLGMITYLALTLTFDVVSSQGQIDKLEGATVVGFLAGFFESFSTGILARAAGRYSEEESGREDSNKRNP